MYHILSFLEFVTKEDNVELAKIALGTQNIPESLFAELDDTDTDPAVASTSSAADILITTVMIQT